MYCLKLWFHRVWIFEGSRSCYMLMSYEARGDPLLSAISLIHLLQIKEYFFVLILMHKFSIRYLIDDSLVYIARFSSFPSDALKQRCFGVCCSTACTSFRVRYGVVPFLLTLQASWREQGALTMTIGIKNLRRGPEKQTIGNFDMPVLISIPW